ncbi:MAG: hypothetical protein SGJ20_03780 [Planctomycetota bacterium]|nr:hypothetical protein [Planctomycetota bacterium]
MFATLRGHPLQLDNMGSPSGLSAATGVDGLRRGLFLIAAADHSYMRPAPRL